MRTPGKLTDAVASIRRAMQLAPGRLDYLLRYADIFILGGSLNDARTILMDVSRVTMDPEAAFPGDGNLSHVSEKAAEGFVEGDTPRAPWRQRFCPTGFAGRERALLLFPNARVQQRGDDAHRLLRDVRAVTQTVGGRRTQLRNAKRAVHLVG